MGYLFFLACISCLAGFFGGLTGTGGIIIPPLMMECYGVSPHLAMGLAQASYVAPSFMAMLMYMRKGQFNWRIALTMSISGCLFSFLSARYLKPRIDPIWLSIVFAACIMLSGVVMLRRRTRMLAKPLGPPWREPILAILGMIVGLMAGITGSGSNAILVPMMVFLGLEMLTVLGACQFFAVLSSASGTLGNVMNMHIDVVQVAALVAGQFVGIWAGVRQAQRMDTAKLKRVVGMVCCLAGAFIMYEALAALFSKAA